MSRSLRLRRGSVAAVVVLMHSAVSFAQITWYVDDDACPGPGTGGLADPFCSIQDAIDASSDTDVVLVSPGTYFENINFIGKAIAVRSAAGPAQTTITATQSIVFETIVKFDFGNNEGPDSVLDGFTLSNASRGITILGGSPTISNCVITGHTAGGVFINSGSPIISDCTISDNRTPSDGGGMLARRGRPKIINCRFIGNTADGRGGGLSIIPNAVPLVVNCIFVGNSAGKGVHGQGGGVWSSTSVGSTIVNSTFFGNSAGEGGGIRAEATLVVTNCILWGNTSADATLEARQLHHTRGNAVVQHSLIEGLTGSLGGLGNIGGDPLFVSPATGNLHVRFGSPCIDAGDNAAVLAEFHIDLDGRPRFFDDPNTPDSGSGVAPIVDMGAFELADCNANGVTDNQDIAAGTSQDCNGNGVPDECEPAEDCNGNGRQDVCDIASGASQDCNNNGVPDSCDLTAKTSQDCTGNGIPDECELDCNGNVFADSCDIADGLAADCNDNGIPDRCDIEVDRSEDCNENGRPDECDLSIGASPDCNDNDIPDECEVDCNTNGTPDDCDIAAGTSDDCNGTAVPDECEADCNINGTQDDCDIAAGTSADCNDNGVPDECDIEVGSSPDCNENESPDECDLAANISEDCNGNENPDECDLQADCNNNGVQDICDVAAGVSGDCNFNEVPDECEPDEDCNDNGVRDICDIGARTSRDCNQNSVPDECDIADGSSTDDDGNGIPDECPLAPLVAAAPHDVRKNRFISINPTTSTTPVAIRVELMDLACELTGKMCMSEEDCRVCVGGTNEGGSCVHSGNCPGGGSCMISGETCIDRGPVMLGWVSDPIVPSAQSNAPPGIVVSRVQKEMPTPRVWTEPVVHIGDCEIAPVRSYALSTTTNGVFFSERLRVDTIKKPGAKSWADYVATAAGGVLTPPNAILGVDDLSALLLFFRGAMVSDPELVVTVLELGPEVPTLFINATDLHHWLHAFGGLPYPPVSFGNQGGPAGCP